MCLFPLVCVCVCACGVSSVASLCFPAHMWCWCYLSALSPQRPSVDGYRTTMVTVNGRRAWESPSLGASVFHSSWRDSLMVRFKANRPQGDRSTWVRPAAYILLNSHQTRQGRGRKENCVSNCYRRRSAGSSSRQKKKRKWWKLNDNPSLKCHSHVVVTN